MRDKSAAFHVALIIETSKIYGRELLKGIARFQRLHQPWSVFINERGQDDPDPPWLARWSGDGIITRSLDMKNCRRARDRGIKVVSLRHLLDKPEFPTLFPDQVQIATRIARHFIACGFENFAYVGVAGKKGWEQLRRKVFVQTLLEAGYPDVAIRPALSDAKLDWERQEEQIGAWLKTLSMPVAIMVNHDVQGVLLLDACRRQGIRVPEDVAVVSVDNDTVLCDLAHPPLSSLDQNVEILGFEAASLLERMMRGQKVTDENTFTPAGEVVVRRSSDTLVMEDERLARAVRFVRENACKDVNVLDIAKVAGMSRRALEKKFVEFIGRTPLEEMQEIRLRRIQQLLLETDYVLPKIASIAGFQYQEYLVRFFKKRTGLTPGQFRRRMRFGV
jgi:LacI family transcriptional regulator